MLIVANTGSSVFASINAIAATPSKNEKEVLFRQAGGSTLFMKAVTYAYDPFKTYGISIAPHKTPGAAPGANTLDEAVVWNTLDKLVSRNLSGNSAREMVQSLVDCLDEPSAEIFRRIINKDMRAGFTDGTINRVFPKTLAEFPYMRCSLPAKSNMPKWDWSVGIIVQEKADGSFANVNRSVAGDIWITTRAGTLYPAGAFGQLEVDMAKTLSLSTQTHGELTVFEDGVLMPREKGNGVLNSLQSGGSLEPNQRVIFEAWDQIPLDQVVPGGKYRIPYKARLQLLALQCLAGRRAGVASVRTIPTRIVKTKAEAYAYYRELLKKGKEGVVCKHPDAIWADNTSKDQVKLKLEAIVELRMLALLPGTPGTKTEATFGSVLMGSECGRLQVGVSGFTDAKRQSIFNDWEERYKDSIHAVKANSIMAPPEDEVSDELFSLFLPRSVEDREDKTVADTLEQIRDQFTAAMEAA